MKKNTNPLEPKANSLFDVPNIDLSKGIKQTLEINIFQSKVENPEFLKKSLQSKYLKQKREAKKRAELEKSVSGLARLALSEHFNNTMKNLNK